MAARMRGVEMFRRGWWIWQQSLCSSTHFSFGLLGLHDMSRHGFSSAAPWEESVEVERDHSLARRLEEAIIEDRIKKAAPDWLPFLPGSSYWMPPEDHFSAKAADIPLLRLDLTEEQVMAILAPTGWPSSSASEKVLPSEKQKKVKKN